MADEQTLRFYAEHAADYVARERHLPMAHMEGFLRQLPTGGHILELGTGGGQDAAHMLAQGFAVTPSDASTALAEQAEKLLGRSVRIMAFSELADFCAYDGVWASAALLHAPRDELTADLRRIHTALRPGGCLCASFKAGNAEGRDSLGRYYNYLSVEALEVHFREAATWAALEFSENFGGGYDGVPTQWIWVSATR